jgi:hypothetical protein
MECTTTLTRTANGIKASTCLPLNIDRRELRIETCKSVRRGVACTAMVVQLAEDGLGYSYVLFGDYHKRLIHEPAARATEKTVSTIHARGLVDVDAVFAEALAFYTRKTEAAEA